MRSRTTRPSARIVRGAAAVASASALALGATPAQAHTQHVSGTSTSEAKSMARDMAADKGWGPRQFSCLNKLWQKESGWRTSAHNPSGAHGIPQALPGSKMASAGPNWQSNARTQIEWGLDYIDSRYGSPCNAWAHSGDNNWY